MKKLLCALLILSVLLAGCAKESRQLPKICSNAYCLPYAKEAAKTFLAYSDEEIGKFIFETAEEDAYGSLIAGQCDMIFCSLPGEDQVRFANERGVTLACFPVLLQPENGADPAQLFAVIRGGEEDSLAGSLAQWCAWPDGQELARTLGFTPSEDASK